MCQPKETPRLIGMAGCTCGCCGCGCGPSFRSFFSANEEQERLEFHRDRVKKELAGVEKRIKEFKCK